MCALASPRDMADAMRTLADPSRHGCLPSVIQHNWQFLKEARGQRVRLERLAVTHHMIVRQPMLAPVPDRTLTVTLPDGGTIGIPATGSVARQLAVTSGSGGLVDELAESCARVSARVNAMLRAHRDNVAIRGRDNAACDNDGPQGAA